MNFTRLLSTNLRTIRSDILICSKSKLDRKIIPSFLNSINLSARLLPIPLSDVI